jgi:hypothetical protein
MGQLLAIIYQTFSFADANTRIHITTNPLLADLWVYQVSAPGFAAESCIWYFTDNRAEANCRVLLCSKALCDSVVYFVDNRAKIGWRTKRLLGSRL